MSIGNLHQACRFVAIAALLFVGPASLLSPSAAPPAGEVPQLPAGGVPGPASDASIVSEGQNMQIEPATLPRLGARFVRSSTAPAPNLVRLVEKSRSGRRVTIGVVIDGQTSSSDIYSLAFDLVTAGNPVQLVEGAVAPGNAWKLGAGQAVMATAKQLGNRIVVGVTKTGGGAGNGVDAGRGTIVKLTFKVLEKGATSISFDPGAGGQAALGDSSGPAALDSSGQPLSTITFDSTAGTIKARAI